MQAFADDGSKIVVREKGGNVRTLDIIGKQVLEESFLKKVEKVDLTGAKVIKVDDGDDWLLLFDSGASLRLRKAGTILTAANLVEPAAATPTKAAPTPAPPPSTPMATSALPPSSTVPGKAPMPPPADPAPQPEDGAFAPTALDALRAKLGTEVIVEGKVVAQGEAKSGKPLYLNFTERFRDSVSLVFFPGDVPQADKTKLATYVGQTIRVKGELGDYKGALQIKITSMDQITVKP